ncbi:MAG: type II secretion system protein M [Halopseudomonas sp.]
MMLNRWYQSLSDREKFLFAAGGCITISLLVFLLFWRPISSSNQQLQRVIQSKTQQINWIQQAAQQIDSYRQNSDNTTASGSLQQRVTHTASGLKIGLTRLQSSNEQKLQLWIDRVEFNTLLKLIDQLAKQGVSLDKLNLQPLPESGFSKARLTLVTG